VFGITKHGTVPKCKHSTVEKM
jgi:hypothetical protein